MSTDHRTGGGVDPGPATVEHILDDLRAADIAVTTNPTYDTNHANVDVVSTRLTVPYTSLHIDSERDDELHLDGWVSGWVTPEYEDDPSAVAISIGAEGDGDTHTSTSAEMSPDEARDLALQLLASAAVVDHTATSGEQAGEANIEDRNPEGEDAETTDR